MNKLNLNKKTVSQMDRVEMKTIKGGICLISCKRGSRKTKKCCDGSQWDPNQMPDIFLPF